MTRFIFIFPLLFLSFLACQKDKTTTLNGIVVDKVTGEPIKGALVALRITHSGQEPPNNIEYNDISTDGNGQFSFSSDEPLKIYDVQKAGYLPKGLESDIPKIIQGETNNVLLKMIPKDGYLKLKINNTSTLLDTLFVGVFSPTLEAEYSSSYGVAAIESFYVAGSSSQIKIFSLSSEETVEIYWGHSPLPNKVRSTSALHDSIFINRGDTSSFSISF